MTEDKIYHFRPKGEKTKDIELFNRVYIPGNAKKTNGIPAMIYGGPKSEIFAIDIGRMDDYEYAIKGDSNKKSKLFDIIEYELSDELAELVIEKAKMERKYERKLDEEREAIRDKLTDIIKKDKYLFK